MTQVSASVIAVALILGPLAWMVLLNLRDRRQSALYGSVMEQFLSVDLRGRVAIHIQSALLSRKSEVTVDVLALSRDEIWDIIRRLGWIPVLSPNVCLQVTGAGDKHCLATFTVATTSGQPLRPASEPSLATG